MMMRSKRSWGRMLPLAGRLVAAVRTASCATNSTFLTMGEAMLRLQPIDDARVPTATRHLPQPFLRSIGGDELNVAVALSLVGIPSRWISVLPTGPMGDVVTDSCRHHEVEFSGPRVDGDLGFFTVLPEEKRVHYQRRNAVFAQHDPSALDWSRLLSAPSPWLHMTGITPLISAAARQSWENAIAHAADAGIPISLDLNHRKQLGSLEELWSIVEPHTKRLELLILSVEQLNGLSAIHYGSHDTLARPLDGQTPDADFLQLMGQLQLKWGCRRVVLCRKERDNAGLQRRWSLMTQLGGGSAGPVDEYSTHDIPVWHVPRDDLGGGSAWAAGMIHALHFQPVAEGSALEALRRADLLSALCQETAGDFSAVSAQQLAEAERSFAGAPARLHAPAQVGGPTTALPSPDAAATSVEATLRGLRSAGVLAILRVKGESVDAAVARGVELASLGCAAIEVTLDSPHWAEILQGLREALPPTVLLGVGTVMDESVSQIGRAASLGATFALSPIDPIGMIDECHRRGVLAVPSAFTSNEWYALHRKGARLVKLFHAGLVSPSILKSMLGVTPLGEQINIMPSGGVSPQNTPEWWAAGAAVVGAGSNLVGDDFNHAPGSIEHEKAAAAWAQGGRAAAQQIFERAQERRAQQ